MVEPTESHLPRTVDEQAPQPGDACVMVIFGAAGDLTKRKLLPSLYNLASSKLLPERFAIIGVARDELSTESFRDKLGAEIQEFATGKVDQAIWKSLASRLYYLQGNFDDAKTYSKLGEKLAKVDQEQGTPGNYFFYLATSQNFFSVIVDQLGHAGLVKEERGCWRRMVIEKPFGHDLDSARVLNREVRTVLAERQIYRIDHYLGKETVQNILVFRFGNGIFEPIWNRRYIDHVQITVAETVGVEHRGGYYEQAGALRDMVPNHMFQLVTLTAMEPPTSFEA